MNEHAHPLSISERADELEEAKMHELERIITKSTIAHLMDGEVKMDTGPEMKAKHPGKYFLMGDDPRLPSMHGFLIGRGPQLASRTKVGSVDNVHLYELMCRLLEIEPAANDGRLKPVADLLAPTLMDRVSAATATNTAR